MTTIPLIKQSHKKAKSGDIPNADLITLITSIVNRDTKLNNVPKVVWFWNRTDNKFLCSTSFRELLNLSLLTNPDLDFWMEHLTFEDMGTLSETLTGILLNSKPRNFICRINIPKVGKQIFRCFIEPLTNPVGKRYIMGYSVTSLKLFFRRTRIEMLVGPFIIIHQSYLAHS